MLVSWRNIDEGLQRALKMVADHERFLSEVKRTSGEGLQSIRNEYKSLENFKRTLENDGKVVEQIQQNYSQALRVYPTGDTHGEIGNRMKELNTRWETLNGTFQESIKNVREKRLGKSKKFSRLFLVEIYVECSWRFSINTRFISTLVDGFGCAFDQSRTFI